jgi:hypothetical protein
MLNQRVCFQHRHHACVATRLARAGRSGAALLKEVFISRASGPKKEKKRRWLKALDYWTVSTTWRTPFLKQMGDTPMCSRKNREKFPCEENPRL